MFIAILKISDVQKLRICEPMLYADGSAQVLGLPLEAIAYLPEGTLSGLERFRDVHCFLSSISPFVSNAVSNSSERYSIANRISSIDRSSEDPEIVSSFLLPGYEIDPRFPRICRATAAQ